MDSFTLPQLKKLVSHFGLKKKIKVSVNKKKLIEELDKYLHFDGYQFHIKGSDGYQLITQEDIKTKKRAKKEETKKKSSDYTENIEDFEKMLESLVKQEEQPKQKPKPEPKKKPEIKKKPQAKPQPKPQKDDDFPIISNLTTKKKESNKSSKKLDIENFINPEEKEEEKDNWKEIYMNYKNDIKEAIKKAKKKNPKFDVLDQAEVEIEINKEFEKKYGLDPRDYLKQKRLKYDKKYLKKYLKEQEEIRRLEQIAEDIAAKYK